MGSWYGNRFTWNRSAMLMFTICRRIKCGWARFDQENSSTERNTSKPMSAMIRAIPLCDRVKGSKVPGKKATFSRVVTSSSPSSSR